MLHRNIFLAIEYRLIYFIYIFIKLIIFYKKCNKKQIIIKISKNYTQKLKKF